MITEHNTYYVTNTSNSCVVSSTGTLIANRSAIFTGVQAYVSVISGVGIVIHHTVEHVLSLVDEFCLLSNRYCSVNIRAPPLFAYWMSPVTYNSYHNI